MKYIKRTVKKTESRFFTVHSPCFYFRRLLFNSVASARPMRLQSDSHRPDSADWDFGPDSR